MKKTLQIIAASAMLISGLCLSASAQNKTANPELRKYLGHWYNGPDAFLSVNAWHDTLSCSLGYVMDAGGSFYYKHLGGNKFEYIGTYDWQAPDGIHRDGESGVICEIKITQKNGYRYIETPVFEGPDSCMIEMPLYAGHFKGKTKSYYIDPENKNCQGFSTKSCTVSCLGDTEMEEEEWYSDYIFNFGKTTLNIRLGILRDSNGKIIDVLKRDYPTSAERYPFTATTVLDPDYLANSFTINDLKIMRNEIFARHGYIFKTDAMKKHFEAQSWYKGTQSNVDNLLNNIEQQNVATIKDVEARMKK